MGMGERVSLRGISWDHPRGMQPLRDTLDAYRQVDPDTDIAWTARSLLSFGEEPLERLAEQFDLLVIDHPFVGFGAATRCILPLDAFVPAASLRSMAEGSVGPSYPSYEALGHVWALPIDAAAQVAVFRPDLLRPSAIPKTWADVFELSVRLRSAGRAIGMPMTHTDLVPTFFSLAANLGQPALQKPYDRVVDHSHLVRVLDLLLRLRDASAPESLALDPPHLLDRMSTDDVIAYCPLMFGYSNYARAAFRPVRLRFGDVASAGPAPVGSTLGGAGIAVSASCAAPERAARYASWLADGETQRSTYLDAGGQPAHRTAWLDERANTLTDGFFSRTLRTLDAAYLRPRYPGYLVFQDRAGPALRSFVLGEIDRATIADELESARAASLRARTEVEAAFPIRVSA